MQNVFLLAIVLFMSACATDPNCPDYSNTPAGFYGGDGSSQDQAIEIVGVEYSQQRWIEDNYPGATLTMQELVLPPDTPKRYDVISFTTSSGESKSAWFWITGGFSCW